LYAHEIFAAQTAREMVLSGDWIHPSYNGQSRLKKPPMMYWMQAGASVALGASPPVPPWVARLPSALAAAALAGLTVALGRRIYGERTGALAGLMAIGCIGFVEYSWSARPDMLYGACCTLMLAGFASATLAERSLRARRWDAWIGWMGFGAATLAKGPHVPAIILLGVVVHLLISGRRREIIATIRPLSGALIVLMMCVPWVAAIVLEQEGAAGLWMQQLFAGRDSSDEGSLREWLTPYYLYALPALLLPWAVALPFGLFVAFQKGREDLARGRVLAWIVFTVLIVMSIPNHRRDYYMLPILAPLAVLMARGAMDWLERLGQKETVRRRLGSAACLCCSIVGGALISRAIADQGELARTLSIVGALGMVALAALLWKQGRSEGWSAYGLLLRLSAVPIMLFVATSADREWKDGYLSATHNFALAARELVGKDEAIAFFRMADAGLPYAQCVYTLGRVIPEAQEPDELDAMATGGAVWVIVRENHLPELGDRWDCEIRLANPPDDAGEPSVLLVRRHRRE
jgi:4-amino-4-deoxy-L-arabinose transferase-like glycosyltransferase